MTFLGIGTTELILILLLLILVFGPDRIGEMARWLGNAYRKATGLTSEFDSQVRSIWDGSTDSKLKSDFVADIKDMKDEISQMNQDIRQDLTKIMVEEE
ncbi:MAG: twin-arginine translocase TatA/TatE family subunit [Chloroflexota bacterium]